MTTAVPAVGRRPSDAGGLREIVALGHEYGDDVDRATALQIAD